MILRSLQKDEGKLTLDCAKATMVAGSVIQIDDIHWRSNEVQGAIRQGLVEVVGYPPSLPDEPKPNAPEQTMRYKNVYHSKLAFDCIKDAAAPGGIVHVPLSKIDHLEIRNAVNSGWLLDVDNPSSFVAPPSGTPVQLEEVTIGDVIEAEKSPAPQARRPNGVPAARPRPTGKATSIKAKRVSSSEESEYDLFAPSELAERPANRAPARTGVAIDLDAPDSPDEAEAPAPPLPSAPKSPIPARKAPKPAGDEDDGVFSFAEIYGSKPRG